MGKKLLFGLGFFLLCLNGFGQTVSNQDSIQEVFNHSNGFPEFVYKGQTISQFISDNIQYPEAAKAANLEYRFTIEFVVDTSGSVIQISTKDKFPASVQILYNEAVRVIQLTDKKWIPGTQRGKPVAMRMRLPIKFELM